MIVLHKTVSLDAPVRIESLAGGMFAGENQGHKFIIDCTQDAMPFPLLGDVSARFNRADGSGILISGDAASIIDGEAVITLHQDCYNVPGRFQFYILNTVDGETTCIYACVGTVINTTAEPLIDSGTAVPSIDDIIAMYDAVREATAAAQEASGNILNFRTHLTGLRTLTDTATVLNGHMVYAGGTNVGKIGDNNSYSAIIVPVPSGLASLAYTRLMSPSASVNIGMCFWDGVSSDDYPYGAVVDTPEMAIAGEGTVNEWRTSLISIPTGAAYAGFTWRVALGLENFNVCDAGDYVRSLEGRVGELEQDTATLKSWKNRTSDICTIDDPPQDDQTYMLTFKWQSKSAAGTTVWLPQIEWKLIS